MKLFVREYSWMWSDLRLSLAECRVYAYIYGLTHGDKGGYNGSKRHLAELLGLDAGGVKKILDTLKEKHLIVCTNDLWQCVDSVNGSVESVNESVDSVNSPHTPLYNNIIDKKQADMQTDFEKFWLWFSPSAEYQNRRAATQMLFEARSKVARDSILEAARKGINCDGDRNPYFFVQDFPEPQPEWKTGGETDEDLVQVRYNGAYKICTRATMELFGLQWVRDW